MSTPKITAIVSLEKMLEEAIARQDDAAVERLRVILEILKDL